MNKSLFLFSICLLGKVLQWLLQTYFFHLEDKKVVTGGIRQAVILYSNKCQGICFGRLTIGRLRGGCLNRLNCATWPCKYPNFNLQYLQKISMVFKMAMLTPKLDIQEHFFPELKHGYIIIYMHMFFLNFQYDDFLMQFGSFALLNLLFYSLHIIVCVILQYI